MPPSVAMVLPFLRHWKEVGVLQDRGRQTVWSVFQAGAPVTSHCFCQLISQQWLSFACVSPPKRDPSLMEPALLSIHEWNADASLGARWLLSQNAGSNYQIAGLWPGGSSDGPTTSLAFRGASQAHLDPGEDLRGSSPAILLLSWVSTAKS